jgi:hypothetical protein
VCTVAALSSNLEDALGSTAKVTLQAIGAQEAALQAIAQHTHQLREAMEAEVRKGHIFFFFKLARFFKILASYYIHILLRMFVLWP